MTKVFVTQETKHNLSKALPFGELVVLLRGDQPTHGVTPQALSARARACAHALADFDPEKDYLLLIGDPLNIALVSGVLARKHSLVKVLKWDRLECRYLPSVLLFPIQRTQHALA